MSIDLRAAPTDRRSTLIEELLRLSADPLGVAAAWEGIRGTGQAPPIRPHEPHCQLTAKPAVNWTAPTRSNRAMCTCWLRSLDELERAYVELKTTNRPCWYAVGERYRRCTRKPTMVRVKAGRPQLEMNQHAIGLVNRTDLNRRGDGQTRILVETWRAGLDPAYIWEGVLLLGGLFRGMPELPLELLRGAA